MLLKRINTKLNEAISKIIIKNLTIHGIKKMINNI